MFISRSPIAAFVLVLLFLSFPDDSLQYSFGKRLKGGTASIVDEPLPGGFKAYPTTIKLRGGVIEDNPFAFFDKNPDNGTYNFRGFEIDFLERIKVYAAEDGVDISFVLSPAPSKYNEALNLVANDCNTTKNPNTKEDCEKFDFIVGDYFSNPDRFARVDFTPTWLTATMTSLKYLDKDPGAEDFSTVDELLRAGATMCLLDGTYITRTVLSLWPKLKVHFCHKQVDCILFIKNETCALWVDDSTHLTYRVSQDPSLAITPEEFLPQFFVWPMKFELDEAVRYLMKRWTYMGTSRKDLAELYHTYFEAKVCPVGTAGLECELPCDPDHGRSNSRGVCICESTRWEGEDCAKEVMENKNLIPSALRITGFVMFGINVFTCISCALWLFWKRKASQVAIAQPMFLGIVLVGCIISSSTILVLAAEDDGDGPVRECMAIPWLYSIGFSITFGSLFAKILRIHKIFLSAAEMRRITVSKRSTLLNIASVLFVDIIILTAWTILDPLQWRRDVKSADKFGDPLESVGYCTSVHWQAFAGTLAALHFILLSIASYLCYKTRNISDRLAESKYLAIAMVSNFQIFLVGLPVLIIIGADPHTSFFVRSVMIWMNDFVVVCLIFGNVMYTVHFKDDGTNQTTRELLRTSMRSYLGSKLSRYSVSRLSVIDRLSVKDDNFVDNNTTRMPAIPSFKNESMKSHLSHASQADRYESMKSQMSQADRWEEEALQRSNNATATSVRSLEADNLKSSAHSFVRGSSHASEKCHDSNDTGNTGKTDLLSSESNDFPGVSFSSTRAPGGRAAGNNTNGSSSFSNNITSPPNFHQDSEDTNETVRLLQEQNTRLLALLGSKVLKTMDTKGVGLEDLLSQLDNDSPEETNNDTLNDENVVSHEDNAESSTCSEFSFDL